MKQLRGHRDASSWWLALPALAPLLTFASAVAGRTSLAVGDGYRYYLPLHQLVASMWRDGDAPWWNPYAFSGSPLLAVGQAGVLYPPNLVNLVLPAVAAYNTNILLTYVLAGTGAALLGRRLTGDPLGGAVCGLTYGLNGFFFSHVVHASVIAVAAWIPWALLGVVLVSERVTAGRVALGGGAVGLAALVGHGQLLAFLVVVVTIFASVTTALDLRRSRGRPLGAALAVVVVGLGLGAVQLLPTAAVVDETDRQALPYEEATAYSFAPDHLPLLAFPYLFGGGEAGPFREPYRGEWNATELSGYLGAAALVLAAVGAPALRRDPRVVALVVVGGLCLLVALGDDGPLGRLVHELPVVGRFRSWGRYAVGLALPVAVLAGHGAARLRRGEADRGDVVRAAAASGALALLALALPAIGDAGELRPPGRWVLAVLVPLGFAVATTALVAAARRWPAAAAGAVVLVGIDLVASYGAWSEWRRGLPSPERIDELGMADAVAWGAVPDAPGGVDRYLYASADPAPMRSTGSPLTDRAGLRSANGFDPLAPADYTAALGAMDYTGVVERPDALLAGPNHLLDLLRVSVVLVHAPSTPGFEEVATNLGGAGEPVLVFGEYLRRFERVPRLPEAFVVGRAVEVTHDEAVEVVTNSRNFRPAETAVVDTPCEGCDGLGERGPVGGARVVARSARSLELSVDAERPGLLVVSQAWFPGWHAEVDGSAGEVVRVDGVVQGVPVGSGTSVVRLRYEPPGLRAGAAVTATTALVLAGWALTSRRQRRRDPGSRVVRP